MANIINTVPRSGFTKQQTRKGQESSTGIQTTKAETNQIVLYGNITVARQFEDAGGIPYLRIQVRLDAKLNQISQSSFENTYYILKQTISEISLLYGTLEDLVGYRVKVLTSASAPEVGEAEIISNDGVGNLIKMHILSPFSTVLAPAGK